MCDAPRKSSAFAFAFGILERANTAAERTITLMPHALPTITPMRLSRARDPFDNPEWIFELKHDGFRALAYIEDGRCRLVSRNGHTFKGFHALCSGIVGNLAVHQAIIDGEICCLGKDGRSLFNMLLFRRGVPYFYAFDLIRLNGRDLRR